MDLLADTHVHLHPRFDLDRLLDAAVRNLDRAAPDAPPAKRVDILCLTDIDGQHTDVRLCDEIRQTPSWTFTRNPGPSAVCARRRDGRHLHLLPGRQIVSTENLEILALDCAADIPDRTASLFTLVDRIHEAGGIPVVPWGFGKWSAARGEAVGHLIESRRDFLLADNGNRRRGTSPHPLLDAGRKKDLALLSGSDPLPLPAQEDRAGSHGIRARLDSPDDSPSQAFRRVLQLRTWTQFGSFTPPLAFWIGQVRMQVRKRLGG